jgi:energy-coupling factor transporter ATP-binding protein EcfA2
MISSDIISMAEKLGLSSLLDQPLTSLSYGTWRAIQFIGVLAVPGCLLLLDEPFAGLDQERADHMADLISSYVARSGAAIIAAHPGDPRSSISTSAVNIGEA